MTLKFQLGNRDASLTGSDGKGHTDPNSRPLRKYREDLKQVLAESEC
jgi:hypothetical protein